VKKAVIILSGGIDSTTLLYKLKAEGYDVKAITFDYGQRHNKEIKMAKKTCKKLCVEHKAINISLIGKKLLKSNLLKGQGEIPEGNYKDENMKLTVVPNRNMILLALAAGYAMGEKATVLAYGAHAGDHAIYPDCRPEFVKRMSEVLAIADWEKLELYVPFLNSNKIDIVKEGLKLGVDYSKTWTCYKGGEKACGKCGSCVERLEAFEKNGVRDPIEYET
jgi:7-cyano-7-deazaguanine synthase